MLYNCAIAMFCGIVIGVINDIFHTLMELTVYFPEKIRLLRLLFHDILYICCYCTTFILLLYYCNNGEFRAILLIAQISGGWIYRLTIRKVVLRILSVLELIINRLFLFPLQKILIFLTLLLKKTISILTHPIAKMRSKMYNKINNK